MNIYILNLEEYAFNHDVIHVFYHQTVTLLHIADTSLMQYGKNPWTRVNSLGRRGGGGFCKVKVTSHCYCSIYPASPHDVTLAGFSAHLTLIMIDKSWRHEVNIDAAYVICRHVDATNGMCVLGNYTRWLSIRDTCQVEHLHLHISILPVINSVVTFTDASHICTVYIIMQTVWYTRVVTLLSNNLLYNLS